MGVRIRDKRLEEEQIKGKGVKVFYAYRLIYNQLPRMRKMQLKKIKQLARALSKQQNQNLNQSLTPKSMSSPCYILIPQV